MFFVGRRSFRKTVLFATLALLALPVDSAFGNVRSHALSERVTALVCAGVFVVFGVIALRNLADQLAVITAGSSTRGTGTGTRLIISAGGYLVILFVTLGLLGVSPERLLLGGAATGIVFGIAAQQSLGNVFAGLVLLLARPFSIGDTIHIRSGALAGELDGVVVDMSLVYVALDTDEGVLQIPNSSLLASGVGLRSQRRASWRGTHDASPRDRRQVPTES